MNEERNARIVKLRQEGASFRTIADEIGGVSRATVSGVCLSHGLCHRAVDYSARDQQIENMYLAGNSRMVIAVSLGWSKNTVIGVLRRRGHSAPKQPDRPHRAKKIRHTPMGQTYVRSPQRGGRTALAALGTRDCRYPTGHPGDADFAFCGQKTGSPLVPYCDTHMRLTHKVMEPKPQ